MEWRPSEELVWRIDNSYSKKRNYCVITKFPLMYAVINQINWNIMERRDIPKQSFFSIGKSKECRPLSDNERFNVY